MVTHTTEQFAPTRHSAESADPNLLYPGQELFICEPILIQSMELCFPRTVDLQLYVRQIAIPPICKRGPAHGDKEAA
jgi:hypothetical protein